MVLSTAIAVFAAFDPHDFHLFGLSDEVERETVYSLAFFAFWAIATVGGGVTWSLARTAERLDRRHDSPPQGDSTGAR